MRWLLVMICTTPFLPAQPVETVDFSLPPREGLVLQVDRKLELYSRERPEGSREHVGWLTTWEGSFDHEFRGVDAGRVTVVARRYRKTRVDYSVTLPATARTAEAAPILSESRIRASRVGDRCRVEIKEADTWAQASKDVSDALPPAELFCPVFPLGEAVRRIGEEWSPDPRDYLCVSEGIGYWFPHKVTIKLVSVGLAQGRSGPHAALRVTLEMKSGRVGTPKPLLRWKGRVLFDLTNRVVVECVGKGYYDHSVIKPRSGTYGALTTTTRATVIEAGRK